MSDIDFGHGNDEIGLIISVCDWKDDILVLRGVE